MNAALSTSPVHFQTLSNSWKTLISAKQYTHKCEFLSFWSQGCFSNNGMEAIIYGEGD